MSYTFAAYVPPHRCDLPCQQNDQKIPNTDWFILNTSELNTKCQFYQFMGDKDGSSRECSAEMFNQSRIETCQQYVYDRSIFSETLVSNFDLVCDQSWKKGFIGTIYMIGLFFGSYIIGYAGDKIGRKLTMMLSLLFLTTGGALAGVMPYYSLYVV